MCESLAKDVGQLDVLVGFTAELCDVEVKVERNVKWTVILEGRIKIVHVILTFLVRFFRKVRCLVLAPCMRV